VTIGFFLQFAIAPAFLPPAVATTPYPPESNVVSLIPLSASEFKFRFDSQLTVGFIFPQDILHKMLG